MRDTFQNSPSTPVYRVFAGALNREKVYEPGVPIYAVFVRRLLTITSLQLFFGAGDMTPHTLRQGNWLRIPRGLTTGLHVTTAGAGEIDLEVVSVPQDGGPAIEFHEV